MATFLLGNSLSDCPEVADGCPSTLLAMVVRLDAGNGQLVGDGGQFGCRQWSVSLAKLVNCCGEGGHVAGVLHFSSTFRWVQWFVISDPRSTGWGIAAASDDP